MRLSVLIPTMPSRKVLFDELIASLQRQPFSNEVEILVDDSDMHTGTKRNNLLQKSSGDYTVFIDDDDKVSDDYIPLVLAAIEENPDCVGIQGLMSINGKQWHRWFISYRNASWFENNGIYYRSTNHISPVKASISKQVQFPDITIGEDHAWSMKLLPLLKSETVIEKDIYYYRYNDKVKV